MGDYAQPVDRPPPRHGTGLMSLDGLRTILATLGAIWGNRTYGSRLRLLVDYLRIGVAYARARWRTTEVSVVRCAGFRVSYRHPRSIFTTFKEIFIEEDYYFEDLPKQPFIIDCGANIGMATLFFKHLRPHAETVAIEPSPSSLDLLARNLRENGIEGVRVVGAALSDRGGKATFLEECPSGVSNRLSNDGQVSVHTLRLSTLLDRPVDLLKVDVEGMEVVVLEELERTGKFDLVARVVVEYGLHATPEPDAVSSLLALFERNGFRYAIDARSGRPIDAFQSVTVRAWRRGPSS
jgi:FkbM family methyltransferase